MNKKNNKKILPNIKSGAFTLVEILIALAILGIGAFAFMELMLSLDRRATEIEFDTLAGNQALEILGGIRSLKVGNWSSIPNPTGSVAYNLENNNGIWRFGTTSTPLDPGTIKTVTALQNFCNSNPNVCIKVGPAHRRVPENMLFNVLVTVKTLPGGASVPAALRPKLVTVIIGGNQVYGVKSFVKLTTVVSKY
ncbi:prepilin-type N-terminal cleavage/methylation domain-containing protein [Candidatus Dojkabacteria bacterium]|nr:prepilin-type N-terminal cleavage/methylation domain-containing protein [Candidatus Dojkabacteria bacterium]